MLPIEHVLPDSMDIGANSPLILIHLHQIEPVWVSVKGIGLFGAHITSTLKNTRAMSVTSLTILVQRIGAIQKPINRILQAMDLGL